MSAVRIEMRTSSSACSGSSSGTCTSQAVLPLGHRVHVLDDREHAHDRVHRRGRGGHCLKGRRRADDIAAPSARDLAYLGSSSSMTEPVAWERWEGTIEYTFMAPLSRLVHLFGRAPSRSSTALVRASSCSSPSRVLGLHAGRELRGGVRGARDRVDLLHRRRHDDLGAAADLAGEGRAARLRRPGPDARRLGRLLPGERHAGVDAVAREDLAGDVRAARYRAAILDGAGSRGRDIWPLLDHRGRDADRAGDLQDRRAATRRSTGS